MRAAFRGPAGGVEPWRGGGPEAAGRDPGAVARVRGALRWEPLFFDWFAGFASSARALQGPRGKLYQGEAFDAFRFALFEHAPDRPERLEAPMFAAPEPAEMLIDEVEAIWAAIDTEDDWGPLERKLHRLREAGQAWGLN
ncbi:hypothetical protein GMDG_08946 [Pseudogymnoascus destructans 20631-21]|uniref:Selenoprotein O n=1 Tax=Pseudogymnoascus destructans (strain ATCC MYA-4855 / 20631-21) TaxID=658429 RepID=L8FTG6_PSED2|nr:hypothetical protein GMDG_08946 [Pseudogymnoascus destructans 20631-21]